MKPLLRTTRDLSGGIPALYLRYREGEKAARSVERTEDGGIVIDFNADGEVIGIELLSPNNDDLEYLVKGAREHDLSLDGLFKFVEYEPKG